MKRIEVYLDESGEIQEAGRPMNVTGIVTVAANDVASDQFHRSLYSKVSKAGLLAGFCDGGSKAITRTDTPRPNLPKRPQNGDVAGHRANVLKFIGHANEAAKENGVEFGAFSLVFPCNAKKPWHSLAGWVDQLLDRSYLERVKDALELLLFECPWLLAHLEGPCEVALDLPTRSVSSDVPQEPDLQGCEKILRECWGLNNDGKDKGELRACSLAPADGAEILTSVLGRRHRSLPDSVKILGARCVRLMDWESWDRDCRNAGARNTWKHKYLAPKQVHYLADLLAYSVYQRKSTYDTHTNQSVLHWYERGYFLEAGNVDPWITASRMFANGDRVGALRMLSKNKVAMNCGGHADFFRSRTKEWLPKLGGGDLQNLFVAARQKAVPLKLPENPSNTHTPAPPAASPVPPNEGGTGSTPAPSNSETLNLLARPRTPVPAVQSVSVRWRVLLELPPSWTGESLMEAINMAGNLPEPICIRAFPKDDMTEFLLDLRSQEDVRFWIAVRVVIGDVSVTAQDATLPSSHRAAVTIPDAK